MRGNDGDPSTINQPPAAALNPLRFVGNDILPNPYDFKTMSHDSQQPIGSPSNEPHDSIVWPIGVVAFGSVTTGSLIALQWCILDFVSVRVTRYPDDLGIYDWTIVGFPILPFMTLLFFRWLCPRNWTRNRIFFVTALGWLLAVLLLVTFGIGFHFWIGGTL